MLKLPSGSAPEWQPEQYFVSNSGVDSLAVAVLANPINVKAAVKTQMRNGTVEEYLLHKTNHSAMRRE
ncbi:MAG: hypothetical protein ACPGLY_09370 [Rubripirellula sp.]